ncbi:MAG: hypothetical protein AB1457_16370 [Chloroflexota bacterium]
MFAKIILGLAAKRLDGYKTYIGGIGLIMLGVVRIIGHYWPDLGLPDGDPSQALDTIGLGLVALGIGRKADKVIEAAGGRG